MTELKAGERLALLKDKHGGLKNALKESQAYTYMVYDTGGTILYKSIEQPDMSDFDACKCYKFNTPDTKIIDENGKSVAQFYIEEDEHDVCHIKLRTTETAKIKSDRDFLQEIETGEDADYLISYTDKNWYLTITEGTKSKQNLVVYVTPHKDPHMLLERVMFNIADAVDGQVTTARKLSSDEEAFSIYTHKSDSITYARK